MRRSLGLKVTRGGTAVLVLINGLPAASAASVGASCAPHYCELLNLLASELLIQLLPQEMSKLISRLSIHAVMSLYMTLYYNVMYNVMY